jgi:hypothetical protein
MAQLPAAGRGVPRGPRGAAPRSPFSGERLQVDVVVQHQVRIDVRRGVFRAQQEIPRADVADSGAEFEMPVGAPGTLGVEFAADVSAGKPGGNAGHDSPLSAVQRALVPQRLGALAPIRHTHLCRRVDRTGAACYRSASDAPPVHVGVGHRPGRGTSIRTEHRILYVPRRALVKTLGFEAPPGPPSHPAEMHGVCARPQGENQAQCFRQA